MSDTQAPPGAGGEFAGADVVTRTGLAESVDISGREDVHKLKKGAVGLAGVLFLTVTGSAPISAMLFNTPIVVGYGNGIGAPAAFLFAKIDLLIELSERSNPIFELPFPVVPEFRRDFGPIARRVRDELFPIALSCRKSDHFEL